MELRKKSLRERLHEDADAHVLIPPRDYIDAVRRVLGIIDVDLCSSATAQKQIEAQAWYPANQAKASLADAWYGRVFLRPHPDSTIARFQIQKVLRDYLADRVTAAILLLNKVDWLRQEPLLLSFPFLLHYRRMPHSRWIREKDSLESFYPSFGSQTVYLAAKEGSHFDDEKLSLFIDTFSRFGRVLLSEDMGDDWQDDALRSHLRAPIKPVLTRERIDRYGDGEDDDL